VDADVIIIGAGPVGLMLAGELRLGGASVIVVERLDRPTGQSRGLGFNARAVEVFDQRGLLPRFGDVAISQLGHFGGVRFDYGVLPGAHFGARGIPQFRTESVLEGWAAETGADIRRGWEFTGLEETDSAVLVNARTAGRGRSLRARFLVGCDGGHSAVRRAAGFDFPGTPPTRGMYLADVAGRGIRPRFLGERVPGGMVMAAPLGQDVDRIIVVEDGAPPPSGDAPTGFAEVADAWQRLTGEDIHDADARWVGRFTDATRQVTRYRKGRVLLAGDAAHVHLPAGGQGLSTGVQDAVNLGWKLAAEVTGRAPDGLLDTYHDERHPVGARLLMNTRAQGMLFVGPPELDPVRSLFADLVGYDAVKRHLAGTVSAIDICYETAPPAGASPLLGRRLPVHALRTPAGDTTTAELLRPARGVLLDLADDAGLRDDAAGWAGRVATVTASLDATASGSASGPASGPSSGPVADLAGLGAVLVRPDGYVAWARPAGGDGAAADFTPVTTALSRWFGEPARG
jgi:bifunctional hydroxylase/dehydrase